MSAETEKSGILDDVRPLWWRRGVHIIHSAVSNHAQRWRERKLISTSDVMAYRRT